ncbi:KdsC family phosphatase [Desulfospira joergensenii]|uniref:KdsC family phosphatase n=1 Tax=Desulfospira joergensenii TaxID=53329 RepID=UPI0003B6023B|nr:HAD hydrolase family protein [Desulfospira joergensenii]
MKIHLENIKLLLLDVDGVLTDGTITYSDSGEQIKSFNSRDGLGLRLLMKAGIRAGIITGRASEALLHRCRNLKIDLIFDGVRDKALALETVMEQTGIQADEIAFMGDDLIDLPAMIRVGAPITVYDAPPEVKERARMVTRARGGKGAVREVCEAILKARGLWDTALEPFIS